MSQEATSITTLKRAFPGIQEEEAKQVLALSELCKYPADFVICQEGAIESTFYIILEGEVRVTKLVNSSEVRVLKILKTGDFFGEMAIIHDAPRAAAITTVTPTTVLMIGRDAFKRLLEKTSSISLAMIREVSRRLRENDEMAIEDLRLKAGELAEAYQHLAEQDFARREFLTTIAHELRTPLMVANGFLQIILSGSLQGESLSSALSLVARNMQEIITLTNDILFLQEMDLILPEFQKVDIGRIITDVIEQQQPLAQKNHVFIQLALEPVIPLIRADYRSLARAFNAILNNAVKFSPNGGEVWVKANVQGETIQISFEDYGVGITPEVQPKIFDRFFHLDTIQGRLFRGAGLGLSIARQVIRQHGGTIDVTSAVGKGSIFTVQLKTTT